MAWGLTTLLCKLNGTPLEAWGEGEFSGLGLRYDLPGWLQKGHVTIAARSRADAITRHRTHQGYRLAVVDNLNTVVAHGYVRNPQKDGRRITYEFNGPWSRHNDEFYTTTINPAWSLREFMLSLLASVPAVYVNGANIASNSTAIGEFGAQAILDGPGLRVGEAITSVLDMSDGSGDIYDYYCVPRPLLGGIRPQLDAAYYQVRSETAEADYWITTDDLDQSAAGQDAHIYQLATQFLVQPGHLLGTATSTGIDLVDSTAPFLAAGVKPGDVVVNKTKSISQGQKIWCYVATVSSDGQTCGTRLNEGQGWASGDAYDIEMKDATAISSPAVGDTSYWDVETEVVRAPAMNTTQAAQFAARLVDTFSRPIRQQPIAIGGPFLTSKGGGRWPLWYALRRPCRIRLQDDSDSRDGLTFSLAERHGVFTTALDYDHDQRLLRVTPNSESDRLDKLLQNAGIVRGQTVDAGQRHGGGHQVGIPGIPWWLDRNARMAQWQQQGEWDPAWIGDESAAPTGW